MANLDSPWQRSCAPYGSMLETLPDLAADDLLLAEDTYGLCGAQIILFVTLRSCRHTKQGSGDGHFTLQFLSVSHLTCRVMGCMLDVLDYCSSARW